MSMFRSAADISSPDTQSSADEDDNHDVKQSTHNVRNEGHVEVSVSASAEVDRGSSKGGSGSVSPGVKGPSDVDVGGHANIMTAALLEFYCLSRAVDILNAQPSSHGRFTRESAEAQFLGKRLYTYKSQFLSSHGVLPSGIDREDMRITRQYYRDNLDLLGASALEELKLDEADGKSRPIGTAGELEIASKGKRSRQLITDKNHMELERPGPLGLRKFFQNGNKTGTLEDVVLDMRSLPNQPLPPFESSPAGFPLLSTPLSPAAHVNMSRYRMEFSEISALGRGSFGQVFHVMNHIDGQHYAVKKIPLSQKRLEQLQFGGENQLETIMKEIRTLARLEHANVVRYYGAWVEQARIGFVPGGQADRSEPSFEPTQSDQVSHRPPDSQEPEVVFEHSEGTPADYHSSSAQDIISAHKVSQRRDSHATTASYYSRKSLGLSLDDDESEIESIPREFNPPSYGQLSSHDPTDDDIFTDGMSQDQSKLQLQHRYGSAAQVPTVILHIQMSLHPISLGSYLSPHPASAAGDDESFARRHCYHLVPSLWLMLAIISGVEYLHSKGIVHRDLKPANIFLSTPESSDMKACPTCEMGRRSKPQYCQPRIGDFGLVADISHINSAPHKIDTHAREWPNLDHLIGTEFYRPGFSSNESTEPGNPKEPGNLPNLHIVDGKLDIYALGVILFELLYRLNTKMERQFVLTGLTRTNNPSRQAAFPNDFKQRIELGPMLLDDGRSIAESLMACISGMLEPNPQQRLNCSDVRAHLKKILAAMPNNSVHD